MLRYAAPPSCGSKHRATPAAGARKDKLGSRSQHRACSTIPVPLAMRSLQDPLPTSNMLSGPGQYGKGSWRSAFQTSYPRERFEEKNYMQIPQGMLRYAAPLPVLLSFVQLRQRGSQRPVGQNTRLFRASCTTRCAVTARPSLAITARPFAINPVECISHFMAKGRGSLPVSCHGNR